MTSVINGTNIVLYEYGKDSTYFLNGSIVQGTFAGLLCSQMSRTKIVGLPSDFNKTGDGVVCSFITDAFDPGLNSIGGSTWPISFYASLTSNLSGTPIIQVELYKYNGTTATLINISSDIPFTNTSKKNYTSSINIPVTALASTDRLLIKFIVFGIGTRTATIYTQSDNVAYMDTDIQVATPFGAATNCSLDISVNQVETTSITSAWFKQYKNDVAAWAIKCDGFIALSGYSYLALIKKQLNRESVEIRFAIDNDNGNGTNTYGKSVISGVSNITSLSLSAPVEGASTYSISLQGTGPYAVSGTQVINGGTTISTSSVNSFSYIAAGGETTVTFIGAIGSVCLSVTRSGIEVRSIGTSGIPSGENVTFNTSTGVLTFARALEIDEFIRIILK